MGHTLVRGAMGKKSRRNISKGGSFALPQLKVRKPPTPREVEQRKAAKARAEAERAEKEAKAAEEAANAVQRPAGPSKKERKRLALRKHLLEKGYLEESDLDVNQLSKLKAPVVHTQVNCQDEAELRKCFHGQ